MTVIPSHYSICLCYAHTMVTQVKVPNTNSADGVSSVHTSSSVARDSRTQRHDSKT